MMNRKTQSTLWIVATVIGVVAVIIIASAIVFGTSANIGIVLLCTTAAVLLITYFSKPVEPGRDKGDTM